MTSRGAGWQPPGGRDSVALKGYEDYGNCLCNVTSCCLNSASSVRREAISSSRRARRSETAEFEVTSEADAKAEFTAEASVDGSGGPESRCA